MSSEGSSCEFAIDVDRLLLIVVGAHPMAEKTDRPLGYRLREAILRRLDAMESDNEPPAPARQLPPGSFSMSEALAAPAMSGVPQPSTNLGQCPARLEPLVCTDLWYLNDESLHARPMVAIGEPGRNAATAMVATRLPTAIVIQDTLRVHMDPELMDCRACLWGVSAGATASAIDLFVERYLGSFLQAAMDS